MLVHAVPVMSFHHHLTCRFWVHGGLKCPWRVVVEEFFYLRIDGRKKDKKGWGATHDLQRHAHRDLFPLLRIHRLICTEPPEIVLTPNVQPVSLWETFHTQTKVEATNEQKVQSQDMFEQCGLQSRGNILFFFLKENKILNPS